MMVGGVPYVTQNFINIERLYYNLYLTLSECHKRVDRVPYLWHKISDIEWLSLYFNLLYPGIKIELMEYPI